MDNDDNCRQERNIDVEESRVVLNDNNNSNSRASTNTTTNNKTSNIDKNSAVNLMCPSNSSDSSTCSGNNTTENDRTTISPDTPLLFPSYSSSSTLVRTIGSSSYLLASEKVVGDKRVPALVISRSNEIVGLGSTVPVGTAQNTTASSNNMMEDPFDLFHQDFVDDNKDTCTMNTIGNNNEYLVSGNDDDDYYDDDNEHLLLIATTKNDDDHEVNENDEDYNPLMMDCDDIVEGACRETFDKDSTTDSTAPLWSLTSQSAFPLSGDIKGKTTTTTTTTTETTVDSSTKPLPPHSLLHQPYHGRKPSVINEIETDDDNNNNDDTEQHVSTKYSGMEVLARITSQQDFLGTPSDPCTTLNSTSATATTGSSITSLNKMRKTSSLSSLPHHHEPKEKYRNPDEMNIHYPATDATTYSLSSSLSNSSSAPTLQYYNNCNANSRLSLVHDTEVEPLTAQHDDDDTTNMNEKQCRPQEQLRVSKSFGLNGTSANEHQQDDPIGTVGAKVVATQPMTFFQPYYTSTKYMNWISLRFLPKQYTTAGRNMNNDATWIGFWGLLFVTCSNHIVAPMKDAIALHVGVAMIPHLTLASTVLALFSSVPIGWLFEAPDPCRRLIWKKMGLTRGETQGTSLALFYRIFAIVLVLYAIGFRTIEYITTFVVSSTTVNHSNETVISNHALERKLQDGTMSESSLHVPETILDVIQIWWAFISKGMYIAFFLVVHLMKLHCLSLVWGVVTEALEYEEESRIRYERKQKQEHDPILMSTLASSGTTNNTTNTEKTGSSIASSLSPSIMRLKRLSFIGFGGTLGGILGSIIASSTATLLKLPGLLLLSALMLEWSAQLSIELGRIMQRHWLEQQQEVMNMMIQEHHQKRLGDAVAGVDSRNEQDECHTSHPQNSPSPFDSNTARSSSNISSASSSSTSIVSDTGSLVGPMNSAIVVDSSIKRSISLGSMKRVASGNSINRVHSGTNLNRVQSATDFIGIRADNTSVDVSNTDPQQQQYGSFDSANSGNDLRHRRTSDDSYSNNNGSQQMIRTPLLATSATANDDTFRQRLLRGVYTIFHSRLLMAIFTYNALYASTNVLLSFERAALVANRNTTTSTSGSHSHSLSSSSSVQADTAFLANINMASSIAIFALQATGIGAYVAHICGSRGTLSLMPIIRLLGVLALAYWHRFSFGQPPNLLVFLAVDEFCKVLNLAIAKPVRESLWRGLSNEARYEAKPIVDTLANRWGGGSAAFLVAFVDRVLLVFFTNFGTPTSSTTKENGSELFGLPPVLFLCIVISAWWVAVSADLGHIRRNIDIELKKRQ